MKSNQIECLCTHTKHTNIYEEEWKSSKIILKDITNSPAPVSEALHWATMV